MANSYCSSCGQEVLATLRICPYCGHRSFQANPLKPSSSESHAVTKLRTTGGVKPAVVQTPHRSSLGTTGSPTHQSKFASATFQSQPVASFTPAAHHKRVFAAAIDFGVVGFGSAIPVGAAYVLVGGGGANDLGLNPLLIVAILLSMTMPYVYFTLMHSSEAMATIGKQSMGLIVVTNQGEKLSRLQAFIRIIITALLPIAGLILLVVAAAGLASRFDEGLHASIGVATAIGLLLVYFGPFCTVFFNSRHQTFFDMVCKTCVINKP